MKAVFDNLTLGAAGEQLTYSADSIKVSVKSMRLCTQMHVTDWAEAQCEDPEIEAMMDWCCLEKKKSEPWTKQLAKLKSRLGTKKNTPY